MHILPAANESVVETRQLVRPNALVSYDYPESEALQQVVFTRQELLGGRLLLIDAAHPIPEDVPPPNTVSIAAHSGGIIPVRSLSVKASGDTINALYALFYDARQSGVEGLVVERGALSEAEQREWQLEQVRALSTSLALPEAVAQAQRQVDDPGTSEHQQSYAVDIRLCPVWNSPPDERPLSQSDQGRYLLHNAWRYGFIRRYPAHAAGEKGYHFRFVGVAHSTAMAYLDVELETYLTLLHEKQVLQIHKDDAPQYLILCQPLTDGYVSFALPQNAVWEASYDNQGYAVIACTYLEE